MCVKGRGLGALRLAAQSDANAVAAVTFIAATVLFLSLAVTPDSLRYLLHRISVQTWDLAFAEA
jgi:membrane protein YdbS with pleckstrin-like domain